MRFNPVARNRFVRLLGAGLLALALVGTVSLAMKELPLALLGERAMGVVSRVEVVQTSSGTRGQKDSFGRRRSESRGGSNTFMHIDFTTRAGEHRVIRTLATFNTEARAGDNFPMIYLPSRPETAKVYSARQLWLPMGIGLLVISVSTFLGLRFVRSR